MQQKEDATANHALFLGQQCKSCIHLERQPCQYIGGKKTCSKVGVLGSAQACRHFEPDLLQVVEVNGSVIKKLSHFAHDATTQQLQIMTFLFRTMDYVKRAGLRWGAPVYFCVGADYLQNYFTGLVISASRDGEIVRLVSDLQQIGEHTLIEVLKSSIFTEKRFEKKKRQLIKAGRVIEPKKGSRLTLMDQLQLSKSELRDYRQSLATNPIDYEPPSLDTVPQHWLDKRKTISFKEEAVREIKSRVIQSKEILRKQAESVAAKSKRKNDVRTRSSTKRVHA